MYSPLYKKLKYSYKINLCFRIIVFDKNLFSGKTKMKSRTTETNDESFASASQDIAQDPSRLLKKPLHSSNPSLSHPEMADYRLSVCSIK